MRWQGMALPGFPIRKSADRSRMCRSPQLIAACHVLRRLLMPRHSPCALFSLTFWPVASRQPALFWLSVILNYAGIFQKFFEIVFTHVVAGKKKLEISGRGNVPHPANCRMPSPDNLLFHNFLRAFSDTRFLLPCLYNVIVQFSRCRSRRQRTGDR